MSKRINALAQRLRTDQFFLASALNDYATSEQMDDAALAAALHCSPETLTSLFLCRRPQPEPPAFRQDVDAIATRFSVRADVLAEAVRRADALVALRQDTSAITAASGGTLIAARDRQDEEPHDTNEPQQP